MNIIIPDIDPYIVNLVEPDMLSNLLLVNKFFHNLIIDRNIFCQWKAMRNMLFAPTEIIFSEICKRGFLEYATYLIDNHDIDIHNNNEYAFRLSCRYGQLKIAQWLIQLGETTCYGKIDIHVKEDDSFCWCC